MKHVMIYGTLGPACSDPNILREMLLEGMDGIRLNLSHGTLEASKSLLEAYRSAAAACGVHPALLIDMQGPELRIGTLDAPVSLHDGDAIGVGALPFPDTVTSALNEAAIGQEILLDDGTLLLRKEADAVLRVVRGGVLTSRKSVALPGVTIRMPALTGTDRKHIRLAKSYGVTAVMQPFVRGGADLAEVRNALNEAGAADVRLFAKIENAEGVTHLNELIPLCDEIVIARGDLGNAMPLWELPAVQKRIAAACRAANRDFTVVTQMLDSMTRRPVPTRAEVSDIFNAVLDGARSVMVTAETASGDYPVAAIRYLVKTVREAEAYRDGLR
ncbi:MAG: pyruvate kinase [Clostridia bacterium]|nr:pyruvate kinase [Clostridia bacterium]